MIMATLTQPDLAQREAFENQHEATVRQEIETFRQRAEQFLSGEITENDFRPFRLKHGIYGQRQAGVQMVRCKLPGGLVTSRQVEQLARIADEFGGGKGHLTTRQNIQYHFVPLRRVADLMHLMADAGLTNREACYNTVRNVTTCVWAGIAHDEVFDVRPYAQKVAYALLRKDLTGNLPRKFKIAFDGCAGNDCIAAAINDIGLRAVVRDGKRGFRMAIGGGLGPLPREAQTLAEFVPEERLLNRCEAVIRVFNRYGNRQNKNIARLKFVVRERGFAWLQEEIEKEYAEILEHGGIAWPEFVPEGFGGYQSRPAPLGDGALLPVLGAANGTGDAEYARWQRSNVRQQRQTGYAAAVVRVDQGNLTGDQLRGVARIAAASGDGGVRIGIDQNLVLAFLPLGALPRVHAALRELGLGEAGARQIDGKEVPYYLMLLGGGYDEQGVMRFGLSVQSIPARLAPEAVRRVLDHFVAQRLEGESFRQYVMRHKAETFRLMTNDLAKPAELFPEIYQDWGDSEAYSLQL